MVVARYSHGQLVIIDRLREMVLVALEAPTPRKATKPTHGSRRRRLADKRHRSATKEQRRGEV